jgi:hypothetical protein
MNDREIGRKFYEWAQQQGNENTFITDDDIQEAIYRTA